MTDQPLLSLAPSSAVLDDANLNNIWNVITKASDLVKDGERIENLAWRHWSRPRRRPSSISLQSESSASIRTPSLHATDTGMRTFGDSLKLLCDHNEFKDWVQEAKAVSRSPPHAHCNGNGNANHLQYPQLSQAAHLVPKTPRANVEIRLVEPTPVPSRVGSLGASQTTALNTLSTTPTQIPPPVDEVDERDSSPSPTSPHPPSRRGKFFVQSSPSKASGSESSPVAPAPQIAPALTVKPAGPTVDQRRRSSGSSTGANKKRRHVSLSTMRGKFAAEKRKAKAAIEAKEARDEDGGWEDDDEQEEEGWSSEGEQEASLTASPKEIPPPAPTPLRKMSKKQREAAEAERAMIEAELEAQRKREMFAKQAIFGQKSGLLKQELQRGGSMVDLTIRPAPTHKDLTEFRSVPAGPSIMRSKSAVAIPVQTGVSVTIRSQTSGSGLNDSAQEDMPARTLKAQPPQDYLETTDEESDDYLATSSTQRKLQALAAKRDKSKQPVPIASPTTDRRSMLTREMSESLRTNIIVERQKSSTNLAGLRPGQQPPPPRTSVLGRGFLRPLTRTSNNNAPVAGPSTNINRTQSTTNFNVSPTSPAPPMTRSNTEGGGGPAAPGGQSPRTRTRTFEERDELQRRSENYDTSYRLHGW